MKRFARPFRVVVGATIAGIAMTAIASPSYSATPAEKGPTTALAGVGAWGVFRELVPWQNALLSSPSPVRLSYIPGGSLLGREDFLAGRADFVLSGLPFQPTELAQAKKTFGDIVDIPVQVSSLAVLVADPVPNGFETFSVRCDPDDPATWPPDVTDGLTQCVVKTKLTTPLRIPPRNLGAMLLRYPGHTSPPLISWSHPDVLQTLGVTAPAQLTTPPLAGPAPVARSDGDETSYFLQSFVKLTAPDVWHDVQVDNPLVKFEPITERLARLSFASRDGALQQANQIATGGGDPSSGTISQFTAGVMAAVPASALGLLHTSFPKTTIRAVEVQNANGDWVAPTPESINRAVDAGGDTPLFATTNEVAGAYPLAWVEHMYAPTRGLSPAKTEALATTIRFLVTAGQTTTAAVGEGRLPQSLVKQALAAADRLVTSNCTQANAKIVASPDPGPMAPDVAPMKEIGTMLHCVETAPTPATVAPTTSPPTATDFGNSGATSGGGLATGSASAFSVGASSESAGGGTNGGSTSGSGESKSGRSNAANAVLTASKLPLPTPGSTSLPDRAATFLFGAGLFLLLRKPITRFATRALG
jgi:ABC-type phosphate transport system substrate-binding protein